MSKGRERQEYQKVSIEVKTTVPPCTKSAEYCLGPVILHVLISPFLKNIEHIQLIFHGTWSTTSSFF